MFVWHYDMLHEFLPASSCLLNILQMGYMSFNGLDLSWERLLHKFQEVKVTDPRDYVYGYLGICKEASIDLGISVDYSKTIEEVFQEATRIIFTQNQALQAWEWDCIEYYSRPRPTMPSWVRTFGSVSYTHLTLPTIYSV